MAMASEARINPRPQGKVITAPEIGRPVLKGTQPKVLPKSPKVSSPKKDTVKKALDAFEKGALKKSLDAFEKGAVLDAFVLTEKIESVNIEVFNPAQDASIKSSARLFDSQIDEKELCAVTSAGKVKKILMQGLEVSSPLIRSPRGSQMPKVKLSLGSPRSSAINSPASPAIRSPATPRSDKLSRTRGGMGLAKISPNSAADSPKVLKKRCGWITSQSDPAYVAYHDEEWGVPVHDDKNLFEMLILAGAQAEHSWSSIVVKREQYRAAFMDFDPVVVASFDQNKIASLKAELDILQQDGKMEGVVENAKRVLEVVQEFGSFDNFMWGFFNRKPIVTACRIATQLPSKSSKSELISRELVKRGFRQVGPTVIYSFMQAAGMANDHITSCFRYKECIALA